MRARAFIILLAGGLVVGCSDSDAASDPAVTEPRPPVLTDAAPMSKAVHLSWKNQETGCEVVEIERKMDRDGAASSAEFGLVYSVPGIIDNKHDGSATEAATYAYRLRCKKARQYSAYSNTLTVTPEP